jgi:lysophospholipase L1-like esterase
VTERLPADDGIHFTAAGYELIAQRIIGTSGAAEANAK